MANKKYKYFIVATDDADDYVTENYQDALKHYGQCNGKTTLWGVDSEMDFPYTNIKAK